MKLNRRTLAYKCSLWSSLTRHSPFTTHHRFSTYYDTLQVKPDATVDEIKKAFLEQSKKLHPDIDPSNPDLHKKFVRLNEAYSVLSKSDSRRQYDNRLRLRQAEPFRETSGAQRDRGSDLNSRPGHGFEDEQQRYWEQFHQPSASQQAAFHSTQRRSRNLKVFGYCIFIMLAGVFVHYIGFRKLEEAHSAFMDKKDRIIQEMYEEAKERARANGLKKQQEILRQKHAAFMAKYNPPKPGGDDK